MTYLKENEVLYNKPTKKRNTFHILKKDREIVPSANGLAAVINFSNNSVSTTQDLQDSLSIISNSTDALDKLINATSFKLSQKSTTGKNLTNSSKHKNIKNPILETLQDNISILRIRLVNNQKTIDTLMLIFENFKTGPSNLQARLKPRQKQKEPE